MQVTLPDPSNLLKGVDGYKTYIMAAIGIAAIVANHYHVLPAGIMPPDTDPTSSAWVEQIWVILGGCCVRSGMKKIGTNGAAGFDVEEFRTKAVPIVKQLFDQFAEEAKRKAARPPVSPTIQPFVGTGLPPVAPGGTPIAL